MAKSPTHKLGQIIGDYLERAFDLLLSEVASEYDLYLDRKGIRPCRPGKKVRWRDKYDNVHDLDYVFERGGSSQRTGVPVAFIEVAWRRYTKHSRNKAQEIQGAILPLKETYSRSAPFTGVILGGEFTQGSLDQLKSLGFSVLYFPYTSVLQAFKVLNIDVSSTEDTSDADALRKVKILESLESKEKDAIVDALLKKNKEQVDIFINDLVRSITKQVKSIKVLPLHGKPLVFLTVHDAISFVEDYTDGSCTQPVMKYEITIIYNNSDRIEAEFAEKSDAIEFFNSR